MASRIPATTLAELIAAVAELRSEVAALNNAVTKLDNELKTVTEFKNRSMYVATGFAVAFTVIGTVIKTLWDMFKS